MKLCLRSATKPLLSLTAALVLSVGLGACAVQTNPSAGSADDAVVVDTRSPLARAQYDANVGFAKAYVPTCAKPEGSERPRVLVTGFGRFMSVRDNATGRIVTRVVPGLAYPETSQPPSGQIDPPAPQTKVTLATIKLPGAGEVDVCGMVLPVYWDLAAILIAREAEAFEPTMVMMDGVADTVQPLWLELGSVNRAMTAPDGSDVLQPLPPQGQSFAPLVPIASKEDTLRGLFFSYAPVQEAAKAAIRDNADVLDYDDGRPLSAVLTGAERAGFPRDGNTYLCNNVAYVTNYAMSYPGESITLLQASSGNKDGVTLKLTKDLRNVPRVFVHWPSTLVGKHLDAAADVMRRMIDAQLVALRDGTSPPVVGTNAMAEIQSSGPTF